jgi:HEAT repeat protein
MRSDRARDVARAHVTDPSWAVRGAAAVCLGSVGTPADLPTLLIMLEDRNPWPQSAAIYAVGRLDLVEAVPRVREELHHPNADVRLASVWTLGRLRDDGARAELVRMLHAEPSLPEPASVFSEGESIRISSDAASRIFDTVVEALGRLRHGDEDPFVDQALWDARSQLSEEELDRMARLPLLAGDPPATAPTLRILFETALPMDGVDEEG